MTAGDSRSHDTTRNQTWLHESLRRRANYLIREVVHLRPGTMIVRDLHRRRHASDTLTGNWHLGPTEAVQTVGAGRYRVGALNVGTFYLLG